MGAIVFWARVKNTSSAGGERKKITSLLHSELTSQPNTWNKSANLHTPSDCTPSCRFRPTANFLVTSIPSLHSTHGYQFACAQQFALYGAHSKASQSAILHSGCEPQLLSETLHTEISVSLSVNFWATRIASSAKFSPYCE